MRMRSARVALLVVLAASAAAAGSEPKTAPAKAAPAAAASDIKSLPLPGAPAGGLFLDYLAFDSARHRVWVPAGATGNTVVIDTKTQEIRAIDKFPTIEVVRRGTKRRMGPSSASIGDGYVYVGNRGDSSVCAIDAATLARGGCVTLPSSPDGVAFVATKKEVWVTTPRDDSLVVLDVSKPDAPALAGTIKLGGAPEGYAVDEGRGFFYTNLEDEDRTLRIDVASRKVTANWAPGCGEAGPRGLAIDAKAGFLMVACTDHVAVLDTGKDGAILSKLDVGEGLDAIDFVASRRELYAAASRAGTLTVARVDEKGILTRTSLTPTVVGAWNAVATDEGVAYVADGSEGKILVVSPAGLHPK